MWKIDETDWILEIDDEKLGDWVKKNEDLKIERLGVGINVPLRVFKVKDEDVISIDEALTNHSKRKKAHD